MKDEYIRYTSKGINLEERIEKGLTKFFEIDENEMAREYAGRKGSYVADCYTRNKKSGKLELEGYTVPS